jgi:hypothetical protein
LGHIISEEGIIVDLENIEVIKSCIAPNNVLYVIYFMGLVGYYKRFIAGFSNIAYLMTFLQNKGMKFEWDTKYEDSFHHLKELLTSAPILKVLGLNDFLCVHRCM